MRLFMQKEEIFTDGSKCDEGEAFAIANGEESHIGKL